MSLRFINLPADQIQHEIEEGLRRFCEVLDVDRSIVWQVPDTNPNGFVLTHVYQRDTRQLVVREPHPDRTSTTEWAIASPTPAPIFLGTDATIFFPHLVERLRRGETLIIPSVARMPQHEALDAKLMRQFGTTANLTFPLSAGGELMGALSLDMVGRERDWSAEDVSRVQILAQIFANALARRKADIALRVSEERLRLAADSAGAGAWEMDLATERIWATEQARILYGFAPDAQVDLPGVLERIHPDDRSIVRPRMRTALDTRSAYSAEYRVVLPDGTIRWLNARGRPVTLTSGGEPDRLMGVSVDVTDAKHNELKLKESEARLAAAVDAAALGFYLTEEGTRIDFVDDRLRELLGIPPDEEHRTREFWVGHLHPDDAERVLDLSRNILEGKLDRISVEYRYVRPDGAVRWFSHVSHPLERGADGRTVRLVGVIQDITERKTREAELERTQQQLTESGARLSAAVDVAGLGFYETQEREEFLFADDRLRALLGAPPELSYRLGRFWVDRVHPEDVDRLNADSSAIRGGKAERVSIEYRYTRPDGALVWFSHVAHVRERDADGRASRIVGVVQDITERKTWELELNRALVEVRRLKDELHQENVYLRREVKTRLSPSTLIGRSPALKQVMEQAVQVAATPSTVLLMGETGTGKERFASFIHDQSPRRDRAMVRVNCAAIPATLIESELFGREKGAYTGALSKQIGRFELANGSTIFLDEVGELPGEIQVKLLRVLQEKEFERLGSSRPIKVDVRIIAASNRDLEQAVTAGTFRQDLYYRLAVFPITIPPLRDRIEDLPLLVEAFVQELAPVMGKHIDAVSKQSLETLAQYRWPGNIRELRNAIERALILATGPVLKIDVPADSPRTTEQSSGGTLEEVERDHLTRVLENAGWRIRGPKGAAEQLGMKPTTLESRMAKLGIARPGTARSGS